MSVFQLYQLRADTQFGIWIFPPLVVVLIVLSMVLWLFVPGSKKPVK
jgi:hypothetical protein